MTSITLPKIPLLISSSSPHHHRRRRQSPPLRSPSSTKFTWSKIHPLSISYTGTTLQSSPPCFLACNSSPGGGESEVETAPGSDAIILSIEGMMCGGCTSSVKRILESQGMMCGGCTSSVKRILESQPQVSSATVSLEKEMAVVRVLPEVTITENWQQQQGEMLANHLTTCGFKSNLRAD